MSGNLTATVLNKDFNFYSVKSLWIVALFVSAGYFILLTTYLIDYIDQISIHIGIWIISMIIVFLIWYRHRNFIKTPKNDHPSIFLAIDFNSSQESDRIADFEQYIRDQKNGYGLSKTHVLRINPHLSKRLLTEYDSYVANYEDPVSRHKCEAFFNKMFQKVNGKIAIIGTIKSRNRGDEPVFLLDIKILIQHIDTTRENKLLLNNTLHDVWKDRRTIRANDDSTEIEINSREMTFAVAYLIGVVSIIEGNSALSSKIWDQLESKIIDNSELSKYKEKLNDLNNLTCFLAWRSAFYSGRMNDAIQFRSKLRSRVPNEYDKLLIMAQEKVEQKDWKTALELTNKCIPISESNGTWRYNKFYILVGMGKFREAEDIWHQILNNTYHEELDTISQVITYNNYKLSADPFHIQTHFIIGSLLLKKLSSPTLAYEPLNKFYEASNGNERWKILNSLSKKYLEELHEFFGIANKA
ncbi:tetratricopeptide repeat protein [Roseivirga sp.]|uniref:tetratricopeptide repeat protein n=1 Tax=Roseivirga sp. TaxID=1964215 RepID=UPI003B52BB44